MRLETGVAPSSRAVRLLKREEERYRERTPRSAARHALAMQVMPNGSTRAATFFQPYPATIVSGAGIELTDLDGNVYLDFLLNYTTLIVGHANPHVVSAAIAAVRRGSVVAAPVPGQVELAATLIERVASVERVRFVNSGTEAAMTAVRLARAHTGRSTIVKAIGGYHGSYPELDAGIRPDRRPPGLAAGAPVRAVSYNDPEALAATLEEVDGDCAAVVLEPVLGSAGLIPGRPEYLRAAEELCRQHGALLVLDEVISFRAARRGMQSLVGIEPDLTTFGKIIGGGFAVGAVGGRAEVMDLLEGGELVHSGTFNGNPVTVDAGLATLEQLDDAAFASLDALGAKLEEGLTRAIAETSVEARLTRVASLLNVHFTRREICDADDAASADQIAAHAFHLGLMNRGVFIAPRGLFALSTVTTDEDVERVVTAARDLFAELC